MITYSRAGCLGPCPAYKVEIHGDGSVSFDGENYTAQKGSVHYQIDRTHVSDLYKYIAARDFWGREDQYKVTWTDQKFIEVCGTTLARKKCVIDYSGLNAGMPETVKEIEDEINKVRLTAPLVGQPEGE